MVVNVGGLSSPPPESLADLAVQVRADGGLVFVGEPSAAPTIAESAFAPAPYGLQVELPRERSTLHVLDALGAAMDADLVAEGPAGPEVLVNEDGSPAEGYVLESDHNAWESREIPETGSWLFFVMPQGSGFAVAWRAEVADGVADGTGTGSGSDTPVGDLALSE